MATQADDATKARPPAQAARRYAQRMPSAARREQLLDAALAAILELGYGGVSIEAIARFAGITRPVIYDHFPNLERLLHALIEREERCALDQLERIIPEEPGELAAEALLALSVRRFLDAVAERPSTWRLILLPPDGTPEVVRRHVETNRARVDERLAHLVRLAVASDRAPAAIAELDVELAAKAIRQLGEEAGRLLLTDPARYPPERFERFIGVLARLLWPGCAAEGLAEGAPRLPT